MLDTSTQPPCYRLLRGRSEMGGAGGCLEGGSGIFPSFLCHVRIF